MLKFNSILLSMFLSLSFIPCFAEEEKDDPCNDFESKYGYVDCHMSPDGDGKCDEATEDVVETICCCSPSHE